MMLIKLIVILFAISIAIPASMAFAAAGPEFSNPTQTNAYASYNSDTNQVQIEWNFTTLPADTVCLLKSDVRYNENHNDADGLENYTSSFTPLYYSPLTATPVAIQAANNAADYAEEVSCTGDMRIDMNTIMNHSQNINNYPDSQIFLTFYKPLSNGDFNVDNENRIDEVFVMYSSVRTFDTDAQEYGCDGQIGSTLYIDQSGIHGNNGDNCDGVDFKYLSLNSNQYVDIGMVNSPVLAHGEISYDDHIESSFSLLIQIITQIINSITNSGGADGEHNSKPTFGLDHKTNTQRVDGGLVLNDVTFDVDDNFYTAVPMQYFNIGETQNFTAKVYAPYDLRIMEFLFGISEVGQWNNAEASVAFEFDFTGEIQNVHVKNLEDSIVNATSIIYSTEKVHCKSDDSQKLCDQISMELSFNEAPIGNVLAMQAIDEKRRSNIVYFNDGITMEGNSQNPPTTQQIISEIKYKGLQNIQRIDKVNDIWMTLDEAEPVLTYKQNEFGSFTPVQYKIQESIPDELGMNMGKYHSEFKNLVKYEQKRATAQFDSQDIQSVLTPSWNYEYPLEVDRLEKIKHVLESEKIRSLVILENTYTANEKPKYQHD